MIDEIKLLNEYNTTRVTFINQIDKKNWVAWKSWEKCTKEEKDVSNLRELFPNEVILDIEKAQEKIKMFK